METGVIINQEIAAKMAMHALGAGILGLKNLKANYIKPSESEYIKEFTSILGLYLKSITKKDDVEVIVNDDYFMSIHIEDYEYSFMVNRNGEVVEVASNGDAFLEKIGFKQ